jgi:tetratricopeptide (TPR) repeat protein
LIAIFLIIFLFKYKEGSSLGRILVWKISLLHIKEWILTGVGFGGFEFQYNKWQADYFMNNPNDILNTQLADYIQFTYNEFFQIFIETGIIGFILFVFFIYFICKNITIQIKKRNTITRFFIIPFSISFFTFVMMSLTSYPLQNIHLLIIFFTIIAVLSYNAPVIIKKSSYCTYPLLFVLIIATVFSFSRLVYVKPYMKWNKADILYHNEYYSQSIDLYSGLFSSMNKDALFLQYYGKSLQMDGQYNKSIEVLQQSLKKRTDQQAYICLAANYIGLQMYDKAESNLLYASSLIPNRLYPTYLLAKTFYSAGNWEKAAIYAVKGLDFPIKVQSLAIYEMQNELRDIYLKCQTYLR